MSNKEFEPMDYLDWISLFLFVAFIIFLILWDDPVAKEYKVPNKQRRDNYERINRR